MRFLWAAISGFTLWSGLAREGVVSVDINRLNRRIRGQAAPTV
jgi:hypothetical protein